MTDYSELLARMDETHLRQRLALQAEHAGDVFGRGRNLFHIENAEWIMVVLHYALKWSGLYERGRRNFLDVRQVENEVWFPGLPEAFDGFVLLQLSDLHLDLDVGLTEAILHRLEGVDYDLCVITGDYRASTSGPYHAALAETARLVERLRPPVYGVLGNHDFIEFVPALERAGLRILLNETVPLTRHGATLHLTGVDDPHFYETDNLQRARAGIPAGAFSVLLAHSPEIHRQAAAAGYDFMVCGHTHAGQICLPGRIPILRNARCPRALVQGAWTSGSLRGYTSAGTGSCGVPVRFFCPPEFTRHRLRRGTAPGPI